MSKRREIREFAGCQDCGGPACVLLLLVLMLMASGLAGCDRRPPTPSRRTSSGPQETSSASLDRALGFLFHLDEFDPIAAREAIQLNLNRWGANSTAGPDVAA